MKKLSFSEISTFLTCPKKYYWKYIEKLVPREKPKAYETGSAFHAGMAGEDEHKDNIWYQIGKLAKSYFPVRKGQEEEVEGSMMISRDIMLMGYADGVCDEAVIERKTTSRANSGMVNALSISMQNRIYGLIFRRRRMILQMVKKSQIRIRKTETETEFDQRLLQVYKDQPEDMFLEVSIPLDTRDLIPQIMQVVTNINSCKRAKIWPGGNPYTCYSITECPYMKLCLDRGTFMPLYEKKGER